MYDTKVGSKKGVRRITSSRLLVNISRNLFFVVYFISITYFSNLSIHFGGLPV